MEELIESTRKELARARNGVELELRMNPKSGSEFKETVERAMNWPSAGPVLWENSVSMIISQSVGSKDSISARRIGNAPTIILRKTRLAAYRQGAYKLSLARETVDPGASFSQAALTRLRIRASIPIEIMGGKWSIDITAVKETTFEQLKKQPSIKEGYFACSASPSSIDYDCIGNSANKTEIEIEYLGGELPTVDMVLAIVRIANEVGLVSLAASKIPTGANDASSKSMIAFATKLLGARVRNANPRLKDILNNALGMTLDGYSKIFPPIGYYVTEKADGVRGLAFVSSSDDQRSTRIALVSDIKTYGAEAGAEFMSHITDIFDGEIIERGPAQAIQFYAFDCLMSAGRPMHKEPTDARLGALREIADERVNVIPKKFRQLDAINIRAVVEETYGVKRDYEIDGLIFVSPETNYMDTDNLKWKPMESMTIDFLCIPCPQAYRGRYPYDIPAKYRTVSASSQDVSRPREAGLDIYILVSTCFDGQMKDYCITPLPFHRDIIGMAPRIHFACRYEPFAYILKIPKANLEKFGGTLANKVIEMRWRASAASAADDFQTWEPLRERPDRTEGNNIAVATSVFANYIAPFEMNQLWNPASHYFEKEANDGLRASNKFRRFILTILLRKYLGSSAMPSSPGAPYLLELGGGMAQDYARFVLCGIGTVVNFDVDAQAIAISSSRVSATRPFGSAAAAWLKGVGTSVVERPGACTSYIGRVANVSTANMKDELSRIGLAAASFDYIVSTFSFHYFCSDIATIKHVFESMAYALKPTGKIIITTMRGESVRELLNEYGGTWSVAEPESTITKYTIEWAAGAAATSAATSAAASTMTASAAAVIPKIKVSVPFSTKLYEEPLCDFETLKNVAKEYGFVAIAQEDYSDIFYKMLQSADSKLAHDVTKLDRQYTSLFSTIVFAQSSTTGRGRSRATKK